MLCIIFSTIFLFIDLWMSNKYNNYSSISLLMRNLFINSEYIQSICLTNFPCNLILGPTFINNTYVKKLVLNIIGQNSARYITVDRIRVLNCTLRLSVDAVRSSRIWYYMNITTQRELINPLCPDLKKNGKMGPIVHVNVMNSDFKLTRPWLNKFVPPGHKG